MRPLDSGTYPALRMAPKGARATTRPALPPRQRYQRRLAALKNERQSYLEHWRDIATYVRPRAARFLNTDQRGAKKHGSIINGTAGWGVRVLASGMMAGITSPARSWFRLTTPDPDLAEFGAVKEWLHTVEQRIRQAFARSNLYNHLHQTYENLATFGTSATLIEEDSEDILRAYTFPIGQYCLANSARLRVDTCYRELSMTVGQLVERFALERVSHTVQDQHERGEVDAWVEVLHVIEPNVNYVSGRLGPQGMKWRSCWLEAAGPDTEPQFLREGGFEEFPILAPRWGVTGEDIYGWSPAMDALGDVKALQLLERRKAQAADKVVNPPMVGPGSLASQKVSMLPGEVTYLDSVHPGQQLRPAYEVNVAAVQVLSAAIAEHAERIKTDFYADLWLMLAQGGGDAQMTAREVAERHEEKMLQLGPVMERLQDELLDPLVDRTFNILLRNGDLPPPPEELQGSDLRVEYLSIMAQAQKMLGISSVERLASFAGSLAAVRPEVLDKVDFDQLMDEYSNMLGTPPALVRTDEDVETIRAARADQAQAMQASQMQAEAIKGAQTLSQTDMNADSALKRLLGNLGAGGAAPGAQA